VLTERLRWYVTATLAGLGFVWAGSVMAFASLGHGGDALAYWQAGRNLLAGQPLYGLSPGTEFAYLYPPLVAQLMAPATLLPDWAFVWLLRALGVLGLRIAVGSWRRAGIALLVFPPALLELDFANVDLIVAGAVAAAMRSDARWVGPIGGLKFAGLPLLPIAWVRDRRALLLGLAATIAAVGLSIALAPGLWVDYLSFLSTTHASTAWTNLSAGIPLLPRLALAMALGVAAIRWVRLAPIAVVIGLPIIWLTTLSILTATALNLGHPRQSVPSRTWRTRVEALRA
jgi:hypothetical protein